MTLPKNKVLKSIFPRILLLIVMHLLATLLGIL